MSQEKKPDPIEDVREGLGLLFRAAKNAVKELPTDKLEETLKTGVREVAHAVESVAGAIEREVFGNKKGEGETATASPEAKSEGSVSPADSTIGSGEGAKESDKVRVASDATKPDEAPSGGAAPPKPEG